MLKKFLNLVFKSVPCECGGTIIPFGNSWSVEDYWMCTICEKEISEEEFKARLGKR